MSGATHTRHCSRLMLAVNLAHSVGVAGVFEPGDQDLLSERLGGAIFRLALGRNPPGVGDQADHGLAALVCLTQRVFPPLPRRQSGVFSDVKKDLGD